MNSLPPESNNPHTTRPLPKGWRWVKLGEICFFHYGNALIESSRIFGDVPVYGSNGVIGFHCAPLTRGPTIVVGRKGSIGRIHFSSSPCFPIDTTYYIDTTLLPTDLRWLSYALSNLNLPNLNKASGVPGLSRDEAHRLSLPLPPLEEQERIASILTEQMAAIDKARAAAQEQLDTLQALPAAILRQAFNGEL
ncbi:restriction endonuclease subunit S [Myxococcota bacterium]|nr:restriction endonuclease subunit S [Myxococcota bacterium]